MRAIAGVYLVVLGLALGLWWLGRRTGANESTAMETTVNKAGHETSATPGREPFWQWTADGWERREWLVGPIHSALHPLIVAALEIMIAVVACRRCAGVGETKPCETLKPTAKCILWKRQP